MGTRALDRAKAYSVVRSLLPPEPVAVIEFGCRDGRGRTYLGERVRYLGLERSRVTRAYPGVDVRVGFDWTERTDVPSGFDAAICLNIPRGVKPGPLVWTMGQAVRKDGKVFLGIKVPGDREKLKRFFREVRVYRGVGVLLAECEGVKSAREMAA